MPMPTHIIILGFKKSTFHIFINDKDEIVTNTALGFLVMVRINRNICSFKNLFAPIVSEYC